MTWFGWLLASDLGLTVLWKIWTVGRPRKPISGGEAAFAVIVVALYIFGMATIGTVR